MFTSLRRAAKKQQCTRSHRALLERKGAERLISLSSLQPRHTTVAPVVVNELCAAPISHAQVVYLRGNELLFQGLGFFFFCTTVPLHRRVLETTGECTELIMRLDFVVVQAAGSSG